MPDMPESYQRECRDIAHEVFEIRISKLLQVAAEAYDNNEYETVGELLDEVERIRLREGLPK